MKLKLAELQETIQLTQSGKYEEAMKLVASGEGKIFMDEIRKGVDNFINIELYQLEQKENNFIAMTAQINTLIFVGLILFIIIFITTFVIFQNKLFMPMSILLAGAEKLDRGEKIDYKDIASKDEMSHLLTTFFKMSEKVYGREQLLGYQVNHDKLTGIKNRTTLHDNIEASINEAEEGDYKIGLIYFDLDKFKIVNDTFGHHVGDIILKVTVERIKKIIRITDSFYRVGGDEFVILLSEIKSSCDVKDIMENILSVIADPIEYGGKPLIISASIGAAIYPENALNGEALLKCADIAMYTSKRDSGNVYYLFDDGMLKRESDNGALAPASSKK